MNVQDVTDAIKALNWSFEQVVTVMALVLVGMALMVLLKKRR